MHLKRKYIIAQMLLLLLTSLSWMPQQRAIATVSNGNFTLTIQVKSVTGDMACDQIDGEVLIQWDDSAGHHSKVIRDRDQLSLAPNTVIKASPIEESNCEFDHWLLNNEESQTETLTFSMDEDKVLTSFWHIKMHKLTFHTKNLSGDIIDCTLSVNWNSESRTIHEGDTLEIKDGAHVKASPNECEGYEFDHWDVNGYRYDIVPLEGDIQDNYTITAVWRPKSNNQTFNFEIHSKRADNSPTSCAIVLEWDDSSGHHKVMAHDGEEISIEREAEVTLSHSCDSYMFQYWMIDGSRDEQDGPKVVANANRDITAIWKGYTVSIGRCIHVSWSDESGSHEVDLRDGGHIEVAKGTEVTFTPMKCGVDKFDHWEVDGQNAGNNEELKLKISGGESVTAKFKEYRVLEIHSNGHGCKLHVQWGDHRKDMGDGDKLIAPKGSIVNIYPPGSEECKYKVFGYFKNPCPGATTGCSLALDTNVSVTAVFYEAKVLSASTNGHGRIFVIEKRGDYTWDYLFTEDRSYVPGERVTVKAVPDDGYLFTGWSGNGPCAGSTTNPCTFVMPDHDTRIVANFKAKDKYFLTIEREGPEEGNTKPSPGIYKETSGDLIDIAITISDYDHFFDHWETNPSNLCINPALGECKFTMPSQNVTVKAIFKERTWHSHTISAHIYDVDTGEEIKDLNSYIWVQGIPTLGAESGLRSGETSPGIDEGKTVYISNKADRPFDHWGGACSGAGRTCTLVMNSNVNVDLYVHNTVRVTVDWYPRNAGKVIVKDGGLDSLPGTYSVNIGTYIKLVAIPNTGYGVVDWRNDFDSYRTQPSVSFDRSSFGFYVYSYHDNIHITVVFGKEIPWLHNSQRKLSHLRISATTGGSTNPAPGDHLYSGGRVRVVARSFKGYRFDHWELDGHYAGNETSIIVNMKSNHELKAFFIKIYRVKVGVSGFGGTTDPRPGTHIYDNGSAVVVKAKAYEDMGYRFDHWELDGHYAGKAEEIKIEINGDHELKAVFKYVGKNCQSSECDIVKNGFPKEFYYWGARGDIVRNRKLLIKFKGLAFGGERKLVIIGGPYSIKFDWNSVHVYFIRSTEMTRTQSGNGSSIKMLYKGVIFNQVYYKIEEGKKDYAVIYIDCTNNILRVAGVTSLGTTAGLAWIFKNSFSSTIREEGLLLVKWTDLNHNGEIDMEEISLVSRI